MTATACSPLYTKITLFTAPFCLRYNIVKGFDMHYTFYWILRIALHEIRYTFLEINHDVSLFWFFFFFFLYKVYQIPLKKNKFEGKNI